MPSRAKNLDRVLSKLPSIPNELVAQFLTGPMTGEAINAAGIAFKQALIEASLNAELTYPMGYAQGAERLASTTHYRNGVTAKTVLSGDGKLRIATRRDRYRHTLRPRSRWFDHRQAGQRHLKGHLHWANKEHSNVTSKGPTR